METFTKKSAVIGCFIFIFAFSSANAAEAPCESYLSKKITAIRNSFVAPRILAPRTRPSLWQRLKGQPAHGKKLSLWVTTPISFLALVGVTMYAENWAVQTEIAKFESALDQDIYGATTLADWMRTGGLEPSAAREVYNRAIDQFHNHLSPLRQRRADFVRLGWWKEADGLLADKILDRLEKNTDAIVVRDDLIEKLQNDPDFDLLSKQIDPRFAASLELWITPKVNYLGKSDVEWLAYLLDPAQDKQWLPRQQRGLDSIRQMFDYDRTRVSYVTLVELTANTLKYPKELEVKFAKARQLGLPAEAATFWRADLPIAPEVFHDGENKIVFKDEVDRWNMILHDPRFAKEAKDWRDGRLTDIGCLIAFGVHWHYLERKK